VTRRRPNPSDYPSPLDYEDAVEQYEAAVEGRRQWIEEERQVEKEEA
jgi:hypothetical protein